MRSVYKFELCPNKTTSLILGLSTYAASRLYNIMRLYAEEKNTPINMVCKGLNNPNKISICVTNRL